MKLEIKHQESYSRGELILRTLFGWLYIALPHQFLLAFLGIAVGVVNLIAFFSILFTGRFPESMYEFRVKVIRWTLRVNARILNLADGYPSFGLNGTDDNVTFEMPYPERLSRGDAILKALFGYIYVLIPHGIILLFRYIGVMVLALLAWFSVLFTGRYPEKWFNFVVGTIRWGTRVGLYQTFMTDKYPPFSGKRDEEIEN